MKRFCIEIFISLFFILNFTSCTNDIDIFNISNEVKLDQALVIPVGGTEINMLDIVNRLNQNQYLVVDSTSNEIFFEKFDTLTYRYRDLNLSSKINSSSVIYPLNTDIIPKTVSANISGRVIQTGVFGTGINNNILSERLDSIYLNSMAINCRISPHNVTIPASSIIVKVIIPSQYLKYRTPTTNDTIIFTPTSYYVDNEIVLNNITLAFPTGATYIPFKTEIYYQTGANSYILFPNAEIVADFSVRNSNYSVAYGYFDPGNYMNPTETNTIDYYSFLPEGYLRFANPMVDITTHTNIGTYLLFRFDYVRAYLSSDPAFVPIYASFDGNRSFTQNLEKPKIPGNFQTTKLRTFDKDFGKTNLLFDSVRRPNVFEYQFTSMLDNAKISADVTPNFLVPNSHINLFVKSKMLLYFNEKTFYEANDTSQMSEQIDATLDGTLKIDSCFIVLKVTNGFPGQAVAKVRIFDAQHKAMLENIAKEYKIESAKVDENGTVLKNGETNQVIKILINQENLEELKNIGYFITNIKLTAKDGASSGNKIHITQDNYLKANVGLYLKFNSVAKM